MQWIERLAPADGGWTRQELQDRHASKPEVIGAAVREIGMDATAWAVETAERILERLRDAGEASVPRAATSHEREGCEAGLLTALVLLHRGRCDIDDVRTAAMRDVARFAFRQGIALETLTHKVWASHAASQDELVLAVERLVPPDQQLKAIQLMNQVMFAYGNAYVSTISDAYADERRAWRGRLPEERRQLVIAVAEGADPPHDAEHALGASLNGGHLHALLWGRGGWIADRDAQLDDWALTAAESLGARRMVSFQQDDMAQVWWSFDGAPPADAAERIRSASRPEWLRVAIGPPGEGLEGFRDAFHGAGSVAAVGRAAAQGDVWDYDDVALLGLAIADRAQAARFVRRVLGPLLSEGDRFAELRETVRLYLREGNSRVQVARVLHVAPTTVAYRVAQAGEILGGPVASRALDMRLALELAHHFPDLVDLPG